MANNANYSVSGKGTYDSSQAVEGMNEQTTAAEQAAAAQEALDGRIKILQGSVGILGGALEATVGALALSSSVSKKATEAFEAAAVGVIAFADGASRTITGVKDLQEGLVKLSSTSKLAANASKILGKGITLATGPVGLIITGIGILTGILFALRDKVEIVGRAFEVLGNVWTSFVEAIGLGATEEEKFAAAQAELVPGLERELKLLKAQGASVDDLIKKERELLTAKRNALEVGTEEYKNAQNDLDVFNAQVETDRKNKEAAAEEERRKKRAEASKKRQEEIKREQEKQLAAEQAYLQMLDDLRKKYEAEDAARQVELSDALDAIFQSRLTAQEQEVNSVYDKYFQLQDAAEGNAEAMAVLEEGMQAEITAINTKYSEERIKNAEIEADAILQSRMALAAGIGDAIGALGSLFEKGTAASKTAALAEIAINTAIGFVNALTIAQKTSQAAGPGAALAFPIFYATQVAAVLGAVAAAKNVLAETPGGSGGGTPTKPTSMGVPSGVPSGPGRAPTLSIPGIGTGNQQGGSVRAYVVTGDVTSGQQAEAQINRRRTL